jgi:hypothetical protein
MNSLFVVKSLDVKRIMMLHDQSTSHIPNITPLKPHEKTQPQNHLSFQASYPHAYDGEFDYAVEEVNFDRIKPIYETFFFCRGC